MKTVEPLLEEALLSEITDVISQFKMYKIPECYIVYVELLKLGAENLQKEIYTFFELNCDK